MADEETRQVSVRYVRLQTAQLHLQQALAGVSEMPAARHAIQSALRIVSRQAGKALARLKELEREEGVSDEGDDKTGF